MSKNQTSKKRKVVQFNMIMNELDTMCYSALCDDGTMWAITCFGGSWWELIDIPQDESSQNK